jgi:hypothetical protein
LYRDQNIYELPAILIGTQVFSPYQTRILQFQHEDRTLSTRYELEEENLTEVIEKCPFVSCQYAAP